MKRRKLSYPTDDTVCKQIPTNSVNTVEGCVRHAVQCQVANSAGRNWNWAAPRSCCLSSASASFVSVFPTAHFSQCTFHCSPCSSFRGKKNLTAAVGICELTVQYIGTCECYIVTEWVRPLQSLLASNKTCAWSTLTHSLTYLLYLLIYFTYFTYLLTSFLTYLPTYPPTYLLNNCRGHGTARERARKILTWISFKVAVRTAQ